MTGDKIFSWLVDCTFSLSSIFVIFTRKELHRTAKGLVNGQNDNASFENGGIVQLF